MLDNNVDTIKDLFSLNEDNCIHLRVILVDKKILKKRNNEDYLSLEVQDCTGKLIFPVWQDVTFLDESLNIMNIIDIYGNLSFWEDSPQILNPGFHILTNEEKESLDFSQIVPTYEIPKSLIDEFTEIVNNMKSPYKEIAICATGLDDSNNKRWKAFTECPSASKHHGNKRGGLFLHTFGVLKNIENNINDYFTNPFYYESKDEINPDRLRLKAILHDIKKDKEYDYDLIIRKKPDKQLSHLVDGVSYLNQINAELDYILPEDEIDNISYSILSHHGQWGPYEPKSLEDTLLHLADMVDSRIVGAIESFVAK